MIMVTGASGRFSSAVLAELRARGIPAVGGSRTPSAEQRHVDFSIPDSLDFTGVNTLLLVSAGAQEDDRQIAFNRAAVAVAARDRRLSPRLHEPHWRGRPPVDGSAAPSH